ncbi:Uncharacterised protein [Klebsiella pneumoniae]|nr:Uncharacterised protein [Klebsiella pneumoniae]
MKIDKTTKKAVLSFRGLESFCKTWLFLNFYGHRKGISFLFSHCHCFMIVLCGCRLNEVHIITCHIKHGCFDVFQTNVKEFFTSVDQISAVFSEMLV